MSSAAAAKERAVSSAEELLERTDAESYDAAVVLGSGWTEVADVLGEADSELRTTDLPGFVTPASGRAPLVRDVWVGSKHVLAFIGRLHLYEPADPASVVHAVRTAVAAGARTVILTDAVGSLRADFEVGQPILLKDHINLTGMSPLSGAAFLDLSDAYSARLRLSAHEADPTLAEGIYAGRPGPNFETPAESRMLRTIGADLVGMSIVLETIAVLDMGAEVLGMALMTNEAAGLGGYPLSAAKVQAVGHERADAMGRLLYNVLIRI